MASPNIGSTGSSVYLKGACAPVGTATGTSATLVLSNGSASSAVLRITRLDVCNVDGTNTSAVSIVRLEGSNSTVIVSTVAVPADATLRVYDDHASCVVPEGQDIRIFASSADDLTFDAEYQEFA